MALTLGLWLGDRYGCRVHEGWAQPCPSPFGDIGVLLYNLQVGGGWLLLLGGPIVMITGLVWFVMLMRWWMRRRARRRAQPSP